MGAVEDLVRLDDPPRLALAQIDERIAAGPIDPGKAQDVGFGPPRPGRRRPARLVLEPRQSARRARPRRAGLVDPGAAVIAINADGRIIDDAPQRRRGGDRGPKALERRACPVARRDGDDDRLGLLKRLVEPGLRLGAVELIGLDALATQRGDALRRPRRSARLDPGLALNEPPGAIAEAERRRLSSVHSSRRFGQPAVPPCSWRRRQRRTAPQGSAYFFFGM